MRTNIWSVLLVALLSCTSSERRHASGEPTVNDSALALVREYVARDSRGERLQTAPWFLRVVAWPEDPAFDTYTVIADYSVGTPVRAGDVALVPVSYRRLGSIVTTGRASVRYMPDDSTERYEFRVAVHEGRRVIIEPRIEPHVLADSVLAKAPLSDTDRQALLVRQAALR